MKLLNLFKVFILFTIFISSLNSSLLKNSSFINFNKINSLEDNKTKIIKKVTYKKLFLPLVSRDKLLNKYYKNSLKNITIKESNYKENINYYTVKSGDSLSRLAWQFGLPLKTLAFLNGIDPKKAIKIGEKIKIPISKEILNSRLKGKYRVKKGDTLEKIAKTFNVEIKKLKSFNKLKNQKIKKGMVLKLPLGYILAKIKAEEKRRKKLEEERKRYFRYGRKKLRVTATAYTSHSNQTDKTPFLAAWNNRIRPGMKIIAVSRDLLYRYGLKNGTKVKISGLAGYYTVRDKMNKRYKRKIDIYMGMNRRKALRWGKRRVVIYWN